MSNQIIGNTEYNAIKEKAYINGTQENLMQLAAELDKAGINYSGRISDYRSAITVETADRARTLEILKGVLNTAKENIPEDNSEKNIIGNAEYRYISNKRYVRGETEAMLRTADRLTAENISFSGRVKGDTVTLTVSGDETQELVKKYFAEEKNRIENVQSAYFLALSSDTFEDGYYISEVNATTGEEIAPYRSSFGDISMFVSVDSAVRYAEGSDITLSNTDEQLNEWRRTEAEAEAEKDRQLNLSRSREIIKRLPMTSENNYEEHFVLRENSIDWIYFNPDGADGEGQFVQTSLYADDLIAAYNARSNADNSQSAFIEAIQNGKQIIINADTEEFERLADTFIKSRSNENVIVSAPVVSGNKYDGNFERIINLLENHFEDVRKYKENHITEASENISVEGHIGTWYVIAAEEIEGKKLFLLEHEKYGDETANIIIDENKNLVMADVYNGFDDYRDSLEYDDGKQFVSRDFAVELWQNGFTIFMNERSNELTSRKNDPKGFDLFLDENNNNFYAFNKDIVQQRLLDDTVTLLDGLNDAAIIEAGENNKSIDTAENYAKDMFDDGGCAYRWNDGITEWQNISASILSGNTEYLYAWLNDLPLDLPYLEENRDVSITEALNYLDNYEKQYMNKLLSADELKKGTRLVYNDINWEVTHVNASVLALKNLDSDRQMSSLYIEDWQNVVTRNKVKFIDGKENSPVGKYVPDESLPLSEQLIELAERELADYENSLDTAEKAKAAAYELTVKRDILSYIEYDLAEDITDPDVEEACRRLISSGYPLDSFYQDWLKNEYDNRMEAIRMTAADTFRKEIPQNEYKLEADTKDFVIDGQEGAWSVVNSAEISGRQLFELESDNYGYTPEVGHIIADVDGNVLAENVHNGFENFYIEAAREAAHNAGLPFREAVADPEEEFNPYAFDGTMSPEDYELMHKLMREDSFEIYQVKSGEEYHDKRFAGLSELGGAPNVADYDLVYSGKLSEIDITSENKNEILESIFTKFNTDRPEDFKGHSLSVSDVVVLHKDDTDTAHYVDIAGFGDVSEFLKEKTVTLQKSSFDMAVELINEYTEREFGETANFSNTDHVDLAYTTHEITELPIEVYADLDTFRIVTEYDGKLAEEKTFDSLDDMNGALGNLDFHELVYVSDNVIDRLTDKDKNASTVGNDEVTAESLVKRYKNADFNRSLDSYEVAGYMLWEAEYNEFKGGAIEFFNRFEASKYSEYQANEIREIIKNAIEHESSAQEQKSNSPVGKPMLKEGDLITLADRDGVWKVSAITDIQIEFENTDPNSPEKSFSRIDFGQHRENLQEILRYELVPDKAVAEDKKDLAVQNAFQRLKDNHDFSPEVVKLLERVEKLIIGNDWENFNSKIFEVPIFQQTYGSVSRVNEKLFGGELRSVIDEVNGYIFEEQLPNKELFSESDLSTLREIKAEHDRSNAEEIEQENLAQEQKNASPMGNGEITVDNTPIKLKSIVIDLTPREPALKTVSNQHNSYLTVQDVVYSLRDLQDGYADDYYWKNYAEAFKNVLDSNVHTEIALPLYKSEAYEILSAAAERKEISADDIAKALKNLELVLQNSHLLKNPEEKVEQISFFDSTPSRKSSDEIGYVSEVPQNEKEPSPVGNDETQKSEKSFAEQVDEVLNGTADRYSDLKVCDTPQILLDVGCEQLPMFYTKKHLRDALKPKGYTGESIHYHGLDKEQIKKIPDLLDDPVMIYDSLSSSRSDSIVVVTSELDKDNLPIIAAIRPNGKAKYDLEIVDSNFVLSIHGREHFDNQLTRAFDEDKILYLNKNKSQELFSVLGLQLSEGFNNLDSNTIIHQSKNIVNTQKQKNNDYTITDKNYGTEGGAKARFTNNVTAIKLLKTLEKENRTATPEEQELLAKYVGWGGIANAFDSRKPDWSKEYNELKDLLTDEEYRAARASTMNAHYTSPTVINAIYSALDNMGFNGGKILEPAMGIGNFFGAMPENIRANSDLHGVELDSVTGRIAKQLYPSANIQIKGYEDTSFENGSFDIAVGNVPFGGYKLNDKDYNKQNLLIHDYFFAKTLDKVRAGGIVAFVTSKGTLDKESPEVRKYLAERAELLGAIRLPNNAFKANAGTEVTSDIIFLQKRERPISIEEDTPEWVYKDMLPNGIAVNKYFADHPEMILGEMVEGNKLYGNQTDASMCIPIEGADLEKQLAEAVKNITGEYKAAEKEIEKSPVGNTDEIPCPPNAPKYSFIVQDDILYYHKASDTMEKYNAPEKSIEKIKAMVQLRDSVHSLLDLQLNNTDGRFDTAISEAQAALNKQYDNFSENYGLISNAENKMLFRNDNSYHLIKSLEKLDKDGNFIGKADIFSKITVNPNVVVDHCDNAQDALILSLSEKMCVNLEYMSMLTGKSEEEIVSELGDKIFQNPQKYMRWESADEYLTGNIRSKLAAAEAAGLTRNAEALRAVMPERIEAADIAVKLGSAWIDPDYIRQFIIETLKPDYITSKNIEVTYMPATDKWKVEGWRSAYNNVLATETYGTFDMNAYEIIEATLNMQKAEIRQRVKDERGNDLRDSKGRYVYETDPKRTMIVQAKQDELKRKFSDWIFSDPDRREKLVDVYNEKFNSVRLREYDGSHLNFVGMSSAITLKEHQKNAVARGLYSNGNTLLAHEVGAGKTFEMIAIAMEGKRLGLHNKSLITAPNGLTEQWGNAFRTLYPNANVLVATEKDFQKENRRDLFAKIATGDWDAVIIGHSQFDMIHLSRERELDVLNTELDRLEEALREMDDGVGRKSFSVKQIEKAIKTYEDKIEKLLAKAPEDDMLCFEKLGIDKIFVDESQAYKNLDTPTKMRNVSGIGSGGSGRSMQLLMKCKYLDELTGGKGTVFASGTPISNSMSEMYTLMRYLQADKLAELGINSFDRWASVFGETTTSMELSPEGNGKYQMKTRFAKFQNLPELMNIFKECADIKTAESLDLDRPDFEMHNVNVPATAIQATMIKELGERAKEIRAGHVDPTDDNMCKLTVDGRKIGLDQRCMNPNLPDDPKSKVNVCINNVFDIWQRTAEEKSTQLIFCDLATPQPTLNENTYTVYRKNTKGGYSDVYSAKLGEKDTAEKIMKKLNGKKPPKNYEAGDVSDGDIIMLKRVNYEEEMAYNTAFEVIDGKLTEIAPETWEKLHHTPVEQFESERKFCVYDDIKQKLIAKGVPEKEIAFIHDVDKAEEKQKLYDKMNKGEIRILIGSTFKCGAGMNAQERMIALHDLDAPMRPSDMEQRHGRIIRQGNTNSKVDIYRYTTDKTFDAYL